MGRAVNSYNCFLEKSEQSNSSSTSTFFQAYSMPMIAPYFYLSILQHAHTMQSQVHSSCTHPPHHYPTSKPPTQHQEAYPHPPYPSSPSIPPQYDQPPLAESSQPGDTYHQAGYTVTEPSPHHITGPTVLWPQHHMPPPTNSSFPVGYPAPYSIPQHFPQSYHPSQVPGLPRYPSGLPLHPLSSLGSAPDELQVNQGTIDHQPANGDTPGRLPAAVTTNITTANSNKPVMVPSYGMMFLLHNSKIKSYEMYFSACFWAFNQSIIHFYKFTNDAMFQLFSEVRDSDFSLRHHLNFKLETQSLMFTTSSPGLNKLYTDNPLGCVFM